MKKIFNWFFTLTSGITLILGAQSLPLQTAKAACGGPFCIYDSNRLEISMKVGETRTFYYDQSLSYTYQIGLSQCGNQGYNSDFLNIEALDANALGIHGATSDGMVINSRPSMVTISPNKMSNVCSKGYSGFSITAKEEGVAIIEVAHATWSGYSANRWDVGAGDGNYISPDYLIQIKITKGNTNSNSPSSATPNTSSNKPSSSQSNTTSSPDPAQPIALSQVRLNDLKTQVNLIYELLDHLENGDDFPVVIETVSVMTKEALALLQASDRNIAVTKFDDNDQKLYEWKFKGKDIDATKDFDFKVNFSSPYQDEITEQIQSSVDSDESIEVTYLSFAQSGDFPTSTEVTIGIDTGDDNNMVHLYNYNEETKQLDIVKENIPIVNNQAILPITHGSSGYVISSTHLNIAPKADTNNNLADNEESNAPLLITLCISAVLVVGLLVVGGFWLTKHKKFNSANKTKAKHR